jgi:pheromone shutdown protein TraB
MTDTAEEAGGPQPIPAGAPSDDEGSVTVVGTAHVSHDSVERVEAAIDEGRPDVVAVELDEGRYSQMQGEAADDLDPKDLLEGNTIFQFVAYWMLSYVQSRMGDRFDIEPGADMNAAIEAAEERGIGVALVDRDIQVTVQRLWTRMRLGEKLAMVGQLALGVATPLYLGLSLGAVFGLVLGTGLGTVAAPSLGFGGSVLAGAIGDLATQAVGGLAVGALAGLVVWTFVDDTLQGVPGLERFEARFLASVLATAVVGAALGVAGGFALGPVSMGAGRFFDAGAFALQLAAGLAAGLAVGLAGGAVLGLVLSLVIDTDVDEEFEEFDPEDLTDTDVVSAMLEEFRRFTPGGAEALIDERDAYIAHNLHDLRSQGYDVVAVVGAGHKAGIERYLADPETLPDMASISGTATRSRFSPYKLFGYLMTLGFAALFGLLALGTIGSDQSGFLLELFAAWFLFNGIFAFGLAKLAGAHWPSALVGGAIAWLTSLNPLLAPGWFAGYVELRYTTVNVADISTLNELLDDEESPIADIVARMFDVPLFRLIMVVAMTNVGSFVASMLFPVVVLPWLAADVGGIGGIVDLMWQGLENGVDIATGWAR